MTKKYLKASVVYLSTNILGKAIPFLLLPILTRYLSPEQYGYLGLYATTCALGAAYVGLRPEIYLIRNHAAATQARYAEVRTAVLQLLYISALVFLPLCIGAAYWMLPNTESWLLFGFVATFTCFFQGLYKIISTELQINFNVFKYAALELILLSVHAILAVTFVTLIKASWESKVIAEAIAIGLVVIIGSQFVKKDFSLIYKHVRTEEFKKAWVFLWPLTFHIVGFAAINMADRLIINDLLGPESVGMYSVVYMFGMIIGVFHDSVLKAWNPYFYRAYGQKGNHRYLLKLQLLYIVTAFVLLSAFLLIAPYVFKIMVDAKFHSALALLPLIALAYTFEGCRKIICGYIYVAGRTKVLAVTTISTALINIALNYILIPIFGLVGAAYSTVIAFSFMFVVIAYIAYFSRKSTK